MKTIELTDRAAIDDVITRCPYCMLGLTDEEGKPYVVPMNFAWENGHAYLHSGAAELVWMHREMACSYSMKSRSVLVRGKVSAITDPDEKRRALMLMMRHFTTEPLRMSDAAVRGVRVWRVDAEEITARSFGNRPSEL